MRRFLLSSTIILVGCAPSVAQIDSFEDCVAAGNPVMESYPEQCRTEDGRTFVREISDEQAQENADAKYNVSAEEVNYGPTNGYLATPEGEGPFPGLIIIHEWWGLNDNIRWYAEQFAAQGYVTLAVDLYEGESTETPDRARELASNVRENLEPAFDNLESAVEYLRGRSDVDPESLASVGWCFGGGWSYQMAKNDMGVDASVMYYGQFAPEDDLEMMKAHIMGHFGEDDTGIPVEDVRTFRARLQTLSGEHEIFIYPNEGHGFARDLDTEAARTAWQRTLEFLDQQL